MNEIRKTAFVTGATGFIGIHLCKKLIKENWDVTALVRNPNNNSNLDPNQIRFVEGSVTDLESLNKVFPENVDAVFHLAGVTSQWSKDFKRQTEVNVTGTKNVIDLTSEKNATRLIHVSSMMAYGIHDTAIDETTSSNAAEVGNNYCWTKWKAENLALHASSSGMDVVVIQPSHIVGPYDLKSHIQLFEAIMDDKVPGLPPGKGMYCHVQDVATSLIQAYHLGRNGEKYLIGGHHLSIKEVADEIKKQISKTSSTRIFPKWIFQLSLPFYYLISKFTGKEPTLTKGKVQISCANIECNDEKAVRELQLNYKSLHEMVRDTLNWYLAEKEKKITRE